MDAFDPQESRNQTPDATGGAAGRPFDAWHFRDDVELAGGGLLGFRVEATDGHIGKVDEASHEVNASWIVVETGPWIFHKKVLIPAGTINHVDRQERRVYVDRTKEQIKNAPHFDPHTYTDTVFRDKLAGYYRDTYH